MKPHQRVLERLHRFSARQETIIVMVGLFGFTGLYYMRGTLTTIIALVILIGTGLFWGYSIQRVHPMGARDFRLIRDKWGWHVLVALFLSVLGLIYTQLYEFFTRGHWLAIGYGGSILLLISILTVVMAEELLFNGYLLTRLRLFSSNIWLRAFIVVVMLALYKVAIHMWEGLPLTYYIELFIGEAFQSYVMSWWADRTGSLVAPFLTHLIWDLLVYGSRTSIPYWVL